MQIRISDRKASSRFNYFLKNQRNSITPRETYDRKRHTRHRLRLPGIFLSLKYRMACYQPLAFPHPPSLHQGTHAGQVITCWHNIFVDRFQITVMEERKNNQQWNQQDQPAQTLQERKDNWQQRTEEVLNPSSQNNDQQSPLSGEQQSESSEAGLSEGSERSSSETGEPQAL